jgi:hypothetical protein
VVPEKRCVIPALICDSLSGVHGVELVASDDSVETGEAIESAGVVS